jgi:hypothetical protein
LSTVSEHSKARCAYALRYQVEHISLKDGKLVPLANCFPLLRDCFYYIIEQTYDVGLHSRRHPMEFDAGTRPFASFNAPSS